MTFDMICRHRIPDSQTHKWSGGVSSVVKRLFLNHDEAKTSSEHKNSNCKV